MDCHKIWHKFEKFLMKHWGKDGNEVEMFKRLVGYDISIKIEKYCKKHIPEVKIVYCDDEVYSSSVIFLIPHPKHGIRVLYLPQCTEIQNCFFLYPSMSKTLYLVLADMKELYNV